MLQYLNQSSKQNLHNILQVTFMQKDHAEPSPILSFAGDSEISGFQMLTLNEQESSITDTMNGQLKSTMCKDFKTKQIEKEQKIGTKGFGKSRTNNRKKMEYLERRIEQLQRELTTLQRKYQRCSNCRFNIHENAFENEIMMQQQEFLSNAAGFLDTRRNSRDSFQFEKIDFTTPVNYTSEMEEKTWIFLGTLMIIMGSKIMDVDGTLNVFKVMKESVDKVRRQVDKCESNISLDFFMIKEDIHDSTIHSGTQFDPFSEKLHQGQLQLEGVRVESVEEHELLYDRKINFNVKYDGLITVMEYIKQHCRLS